MILNRRTLGLMTAILATIGAPTLAAAARRIVTDPRPNFIDINFDDQCDHPNDSMSYLPNYKAAFAKGIRFLNSFVDNPSCGSSRVSSLTGLNLLHHDLPGDRNANGGWQAFQAKYGSANLLKDLHDAGYRVCVLGRVMTDFIQSSTVPCYIDEYHLLCGTNNPFAYKDFFMNDNGVVTRYNDGEYSTDMITAKAQAFIAAQTGDKPWALFVWYGCPHGDGYMNVDDAPTPADQDIDAVVPTQPQPANGVWNEADVSDKPEATVNNLDHPLADPTVSQFVFQSRRRAMLCGDRGIGLIRQTLKDYQWNNSTDIMIRADNGYSEYAHREPSKILVYDADQRVPGVYLSPLIPTTGQELTNLVNQLDFTATIYDRAGVTPSNPQDGMSLVPLFGGGVGVPWRTEILVENTWTTGLRTDQGELYTVINRPGYPPAKEYYNPTGMDPDQMRNLFDDAGTGPIKPQYAARVAVLEAKRFAIVGY